MLTNFFKTVDSYGAMLNKLAISNFFVCLIAFYFLTSQSPALQRFVNDLPLQISISGLKLNIAYIIPPLLLAIIFRAIKLHDKISTVFQIRAYYDWNYILKPMIKSVEVEIQKEVAISHRRTLMSNVFYKYVSSKHPEPVVDKHIIEMVLDQLTWYWMMIENAFITFIMCIILVWLGALEHLLPLFYLALGLVIFSKYLQLAAAKYTAQEVETILASHRRKQEIKEQFNAVQD